MADGKKKICAINTRAEALNNRIGVSPTVSGGTPEEESASALSAVGEQLECI